MIARRNNERLLVYGWQDTIQHKMKKTARGSNYVEWGTNKIIASLSHLTNYSHMERLSNCTRKALTSILRCILLQDTNYTLCASFNNTYKRTFVCIYPRGIQGSGYEWDIHLTWECPKLIFIPWPYDKEEKRLPFIASPNKEVDLIRSMHKSHTLVTDSLTSITKLKEALKLNFVQHFVDYIAKINFKWKYRFFGRIF